MAGRLLSVVGVTTWGVESNLGVLLVAGVVVAVLGFVAVGWYWDRLVSFVVLAVGHGEFAEANRALAVRAA